MLYDISPSLSDLLHYWVPPACWVLEIQRWPGHSPYPDREITLNLLMWGFCGASRWSWIFRLKLWSDVQTVDCNWGDIPGCSRLWVGNTRPRTGYKVRSAMSSRRALGCGCPARAEGLRVRRATQRTAVRSRTGECPETWKDKARKSPRRWKNRPWISNRKKPLDSCSGIVGVTVREMAQHRCLSDACVRREEMCSGWS